MSSAPREENRVPGLVAKSDADNSAVVVEADPATKRLKVNATVSGVVTTASSLPAVIISNQQAVTASSVVLPTNALTQGFVLTALSTNLISVYWGPSGVTTSTGVELPPGSSVFIPVSNTNVIYVVASTTGATVTFGGN